MRMDVGGHGIRAVFSRVVVFLCVGFSEHVGADELPVINPTQVTFLGKAWATNTINTVIFRHHGLVSKGKRQVTAFYRDADSLAVVLRDLDTGTVERSDIEGSYNVYDAHNAISIGIDSADVLHLAYDHHNTRLRYRRSRSPWSIDKWTEEIGMTGTDEDRVTYPAFISPRDQRPMLFLFRKGESGKGAACLKEYESSKQRWRDIEPCVFSGANNAPWTSNSYWNHPGLGPDGEIHIAVVWRTHSVGQTERLVNNIDVDHAVSGDNGKTWRSSRGLKFRMPITQVNAETVFPVSPGSNLINQSSLAVDSKGYPHIVFYADDLNGIPQYQHLWFDGRKWQHDFISERVEPFDLLGGGTLQIPISRPEIVIDNRDRVYVIYRGDLTENRMSVQRLTPPEYSPDESERRVLWDEPVGFAEPIVDRALWKEEGVLSMLIQWNGQPPHDAEAEPR